ncbi:hypothetical protein AB0I53_35310 [Saccharopolyspora sp. NPDC050389]|uniref:hypothetical protein n=1 Tax=Saccharopolyspora sp. NPDC050389 TaxID=3155516 RepID=UPI0033D86F83
MVGWLRRKSEKAQPSAATTDESTPWRGGDLIAEPMPVSVGRQGRKTVPGVLLSAGEVQVRLHADELRQLAAGKLDIVESVGDEPLAFLARASAAAPDSLAAEQTRDLPADSVVPLPASTTSPPIAVLTGDALADFTRWARGLTG